jgi:peptide/nickel transport system substrate-binding protein
MRLGRRAAALALMLALALTGCEDAAPVSPTEPAPTVSATPTPTETAGTAGFVLPCYRGESFHPLTGSNRTNLNLAPLVYEGLFELDGTFTPKAVLCGAQTVSEDGLTWTFTLRPGVTFSDGVPLTPGDVVYSFQTAMVPGSPYAARLGGVKSVRAAGEDGVTITLSTPNGAFPALLDVPIVREGESGPLGTGPYALAEEGEDLFLRRNPGWWQGKALPEEEIRLYSVQAADALIHAFDTREISLVAADLTGTNALGFSGSYEVWDYPTSVMLYVGYNGKKGPCKDEAVRKALSYGFDRAAVAKSLLSGHATAAALPFSPATANYDAARAEALAYAPQTVDELLTAAGWTQSNGVRTQGRETLALTLLVNNDNTYKLAVAEYLAADLAKAGVEVELKKLTWEDYNAALAAGDFDLYLGQVKLTGDFDLTPLLRSGGALNYGGYTDPDTDLLLAEYLAAGDVTRPAAASNLCRRLGETNPITVLCFKNWSVLTHWGKITGVEATQQNVFSDFSEWETH